MSKVHRVILLGLLVSFQCQALLPQSPKPCREASKYEGIHSLIDIKPLVVSRVRGRVVVQGLNGEVRRGETPGAVCLSIFTSDSHRYVVSTTVDKDGRFVFDHLPPGHYRLIARAEAFCTGNIPITVKRIRRASVGRGIIVYFRIPAIDVCTSAGYDRGE